MKLKLFFLLLTAFWIGCSDVYHVASVEETNVNVKELDADASVTALIAPYKQQLDQEMNTVIGYCEKTLTKQRPESTLGNWFSDVLHKAANDLFDVPIAFAVQNYGGLRIPNITKGDVTKRKIYELMPFDNTLMLIEFDAMELMKFINQMAGSGGWPQSGTLRYVIEDRMATAVTINGTSIKDDQMYWVAMPDYIANGGDGTFYLKDNNRKDPGILLREVAIEQIMKNTASDESITASLDQRVISNN